MTLFLTHTLVFVAGAIAALMAVSKSLSDGDTDALANAPRPRAAPPEPRFGPSMSERR